MFFVVLENFPHIYQGYKLNLFMVQKLTKCALETTSPAGTSRSSHIKVTNK